MNLERRVLAAALGTALLAAACGGGTSSPSATAAGGAGTPPASQPAASSDNATPTPAASAQPSSSGVEPSFAPGAAGDLEAMLPDAAGGLTFQKSSFDGATIGAAGLGVDTGELDPILKDNGKTLADVRVAIASSGNAETATLIWALQVKGLDATKLLGVTGVDQAQLSPVTIGGKRVLSTGSSGFSVILYTKGDVMFEILFASDAAAQDILAQLP